MTPTCAQIEWRTPPPVDPSSNVMAFLGDAVDRLDDLRDLSQAHGREILDQRTDAAADLREMDSYHTRTIDTLRAEHAAELRDKESKRLDAILTNVSETAVATAAAAENRATTLANTVTTSADAMRNQVASAAQAANDNLDRRFGPIQASIEEIRKFQFETQGGKAGKVEVRADVADNAPILAAIAELTKAQAVAAGAKVAVVESHAKQNNTALWIGLAVGVLGVILPGSLTVIGIIVTVMIQISK